MSEIREIEECLRLKGWTDEEIGACRSRNECWSAVTDEYIISKGRPVVAPGAWANPAQLRITLEKLFLWPVSKVDAFFNRYGDGPYPLDVVVAAQETRGVAAGEARAGKNFAVTVPARSVAVPDIRQLLHDLLGYDMVATKRIVDTYGKGPYPLDLAQEMESVIGRIPMKFEREELPVPPPTAIESTLTERGKRYGSFDGHAMITQMVKRSMDGHPGWLRLTDDQREALEMIAHKIGRIINGDPNYADSWHDIAGYAKLVEDRLNKR